MRVLIRLDSVFSEALKKSFLRLQRKLKRESSPEPAILKVSQVRREIRRSIGEESGEAVLSSLFSIVFSQVMGRDQRLGWQAVLDQDSLGDAIALQNHVYERIVGPFLREREAALSEHGADVLDFWQAVAGMCRWICQELQEASDAGKLRYDPRTDSWQGANAFLALGDDLVWDVKDPEWSAPVRVSGAADGVWRNPATGEWQIVQWRAASVSLEDGLTEACLYRCLLGSGPLSVLSFGAGTQSRYYPDEQLVKLEPALKLLVARAAGVLPGQERPEPSEEHRELALRLVQILREFGPVVTMRGDPVVGPSFLRYTVHPGKGVRVKSILDKADDLQIQLGLPEAPIIHKSEGLLVIDVQRQDRQLIPFRGIRAALPPAPANSKALAGVAVDGSLRFLDLASNESAHILVAGATGSGKTEWLRSALASLICTNTPDTLRLVLIDPKRTAFCELKHSPYLWDASSLVSPPDQPVASILQRLLDELEVREQLLQRHNCSDFAQLSATIARPTPRVVCFCDDYAALAADRDQRREVEELVIRLGGRARAAGIHLIIAMQDPRRELLSPAIKNNLGGRVCLKVANYYHSMMMLGEQGAERLLGQGDLLMKTIGDPIRLQTPHLSAGERADFFQGPSPQASAELQAAG